MKKHFSNPTDIFLGAFALFLSGTILTYFIILTIINLTKSSPKNWGQIAILILLYLIPISFAVLSLCYMNKYKGYLYEGSDFLILTKGKKQQRVNISDIRWIELKHDVRGGLSHPPTSTCEWKFQVFLTEKKEPLSFLITNNIMIDIIKKHQIRIMPDEYNKAFLNGTLDLKKYSKKENGNK